jgi:beta-ureidopropionase / N-carbamoyl-L-amino-acid hydrolase
MTAALSLDQLNAASLEQAVAQLDGVYEHSPWIAEAALKSRPFSSLAQLKRALAEVVRGAGVEAQLKLLRAHPELAGKAMLAKALTAESSNEQSVSGLTHCSAEELALIQNLNAAYNAKFGWPFLLAVRGPRGLGLTRGEIIATLQRRLAGHPEFELAECLRNIHRIAEIRLNDKFGVTPTLGNTIWDWCESLGEHSDPEYKTQGQLTVTYLTPAHRAVSDQLGAWMRECGFDDISVDAVGNVVGVYFGEDRNAKRLLTGSHFDTVRNAGKYDGRLGILVPMLCVRELKAQGKRLPFGIEVVGFSEEEGQRYKATFLGSGALIGQFNGAWLEQQDAIGVTMRSAMQQAGLKAADIAGITRDAANYLGFVEVHIEQGPVLNALDLPLGVVTSINGSVRYTGEVVGMASHAGTTPMDTRRDAAMAVAELALFMERRAASAPNVVATMGMLNVPGGSMNVVPGKCQFSLDMRATTDAARDACAAAVLAELSAICQRRGVSHTLEQTMQAAAAPSAPALQAHWEHAVAAMGLPVFKLPSGAGHDAMKLHEVMPQAMLFVRGGNSGISHNPLETITADDAQLCVEAFQHLLNQLATESA